MSDNPKPIKIVYTGKSRLKRSRKCPDKHFSDIKVLWLALNEIEREYIFGNSFRNKN
jgi:hypothetical protein